MANYGKRMVSEVDIAQIGEGGGTEVIANPTLAGTEADLTGLQVGDTKYAVPQGGSGSQLYQHNIYIKHLDIATYDSFVGVASFVSSDSAAITSMNIIAKLKQAGYTASNKWMPFAGGYYYNTDSALCMLAGLGVKSDSNSELCITIVHTSSSTATEAFIYLDVNNISPSDYIIDTVITL